MASRPAFPARDRRIFDGVLIIGGGLAGLSAALAAAPRQVLVLSGSALGDGCASAWAQGGMAAALNPADDPARHAEDTLMAGAGLCDPAAVRILTEDGPGAVRRLAALGAPFDRDAAGAFIQGLEAAHSFPRIAKVGGDGAGAAIMRAVFAAVKAESRIEVRENVEVRALLSDSEGRIRGVLATQAGALVEIIAPAAILATGGLGGLYAVTTNPARARGEGLAMAALAGARIIDPEFVQFHPTALDVPADPAPLATEALRGDGARLVGASGEAFMQRYHPAGDLAPRDVVSRAIETERVAGRGAFLDARAAVGEAFPDAFPAVFAHCMAAGIDPRSAVIPVSPAAHYHMGGVWTDAEGRTSLPGLFAAGECASTGVHGANRLASNSLLEAAVFGRRAGLAARDAVSLSTAPLSSPSPPELRPDVMARLRRRMSRDAGVVRDASALTALAGWLNDVQEGPAPALPLTAARLVVNAALARRESRGAHFRSDYPEPASHAAHTVIETASLAARQAA